MLQGKVVAITGAASGIGRAIAVAAATHGASAVLIADIMDTPREGGEPTQKLVEALGARAIFQRVDVTRREELDALADVAAPLGGIDCMVCNAGIASPEDGPAVPDDVFERMIAVNLRGVLATAQVAADQMTRRGTGGSIVLISSMAGLRAAAITTGYSATKGGVNMLAPALAAAHGPAGIRVNAVCPGLIDTALVESSPGIAKAMEPMVARMPLRRLGRPEEVADVVAWLASDLSTFVTGVVLPVDGGQTGVF
jgi:L-rhamnose 1-dehydrogenase